MKRRLRTLILLTAGTTGIFFAGQRGTGEFILTDTVSPTSWSLLIEASATGLLDSLARFGVESDATDGYDSQYEIPRPPPPPGPSLQVYFPHEGGNWPVILGTKYAVDYTDPVDPVWNITVETNTSPGEVTLRWDTSGINQLPISYQILLKDSASGTIVFLRNVDSYTFPYTGPKIFTAWVELTTSLIGIEAGWNIVSVPRLVTDSAKATLFPGGISSAYEYHNGYFTRDTLTTGKGYWIKFPSASTVGMTGLGIDTLDIPVSEGWNLIGTISTTVPVPTSPIITSLFYRYAGGYHAADSLHPGRGYWIKVAGDGILSLGSFGGGLMPAAGGMAAGRFLENSPEQAVVFSVADTFTLTGPGGETVHLYGLREPADLHPDRFAMPPAPPGNSFDARFLSDRVAEVTVPDPGTTREFSLAVRSAAGQVYLTIASASGHHRYDLNIGPGLWKAISRSSEPVAIACDPGRTIITMRAVESDPSASWIIKGQNYPNPFNPSTVFTYILPEDATTEMDITDINGRSVLSIPAAVQTAGPHRYLFDAPTAGIAGGIYFFRLRATGVSSGNRYHTTTKMIYLR